MAFSDNPSQGSGGAEPRTNIVVNVNTNSKAQAQGHNEKVFILTVHLVAEPCQQTRGPLPYGDHGDYVKAGVQIHVLLGEVSI